MIHKEYFTFNAFQTRCSVIWDEEGHCAIADPGFETSAERDSLIGFINSKGLKPVCILLTHGHFDHVLGTAELSATYGGLPIYMHPSDKVTLENNSYFCRFFGAPMPAAFETTDVTEGTEIKVGSLTFEVIETPGHTPGGVCYLERESKYMLSGDTLFAGAIGRTDHPGGDYDAIIKSILEKLVVLDGEIEVVPGHGPTSSIAEEGMTNPFLMPFNEPYEE
ncbi:MAG: MBL fold metallo-hydrolase [Bacteroidales bacterium]|nr:MBL fold metallo-hydrolase [Bacteroidales bacterium]